MQQKVDFIQLLAMISSMVGTRSSKTLPKAKLATRKGHGHCLMVWAGLIHYSFWIPEKTLHLKSTLSRLMRCTKSCNTCSWLWSTEKAQFFSMTTLNCMLQNVKSLSSLTVMQHSKHLRRNKFYLSFHKDLHHHQFCIKRTLVSVEKRCLQVKWASG